MDRSGISLPAGATEELLVDTTGIVQFRPNHEQSTRLGDAFTEIDNDGDGFVNFPYDPGCTSLLSTREISPLVPLFSSFGLCLLVVGLLLA